MALRNHEGEATNKKPGHWKSGSFCEIRRTLELGGLLALCSATTAAARSMHPSQMLASDLATMVNLLYRLAAEGANSGGFRRTAFPSGGLKSNNL
jgi:hypothetical protein